MNTKAIIQKHEELIKGILIKWNQLLPEREYVYGIDESNIDTVASEIAQSLLQEQDKTPIEQIREAFEPIQMGANMVYATANNHIPITPSGKELSEEELRKELDNAYLKGFETGKFRSKEELREELINYSIPYLSTDGEFMIGEIIKICDEFVSFDNKCIAIRQKLVSYLKSNQ